MNYTQEIDLPRAMTCVKTYLLDLQKRLCHFLEEEDGKAVFAADEWQHQAGGGGITRVMAEGAIIEKGGVNFSHVKGKSLPQAATAKRPELAQYAFQASGVSVVIHPLNPYVPTSHFNVRFIAAESAGKPPVWWFGGGFDLTPYYGFHEDCVHWHQMAKQACDPYGEDVYRRYKQWADAYFFLKHRQEPRGIGGIFFDDVSDWAFDEAFSFVQNVSEHYIKAYQPILNRRKHTPYGQRELDFQAYRRGRYVEFNLLYDRGTLFGLQSAGRTESILMSLPARVAWHYDWKPLLGSPEAELYTHFLPARDWV